MATRRLLWMKVAETSYLREGRKKKKKKKDLDSGIEVCNFHCVPTKAKKKRKK